MNHRQFIGGLLLWLGLLFGGARWAANPMFWTERDDRRFATAEQVAAAFPVHFASLPPSPIPGYADRIANEEAEPPAEFDVLEWSIREARIRALLVFIIWMGSGFIIHWFIGRIVRGQKDYT